MEHGRNYWGLPMSDYPMTEVEGYIDQALALLPPAMDTRKARVMLRAISLQESRMKHRWQVIDGGGKGPARGLWQFERGGGVKGVLNHANSQAHARAICAARGVEPEAKAVWLALETDDVLAAAFARLLLWTDMQSLPLIGNRESAWECYIRNWRPGKPHYSTWPNLYSLAVGYDQK